MPDAKHAQQTQAQTKVQQRDNQRSFFGITLVDEESRYMAHPLGHSNPEPSS